MKTKINESILIFLKGFLMGICDVIPGISGGTIAFITGIYERLMKAVKGFSFSLLGSILTLNKNSIKKEIKHIDLPFLIPLGLGIGIAFLLLSKVMLYLLEYYFTFTMSFFVGLILASSYVIFSHIKYPKKNSWFGVLGFLAGISLLFIIPANPNPNVLYILLAGFLAISAMFLPGISGSFILLLLGVYEFILEVIHNAKEQYLYLIVFLVGASAGAYTISRVVSYLFKKDKDKTLYVLLGLVIGTLSIPIKNIVMELTGSLTEISIMAGFFLLGLGIVKVVEKN